MWADNQISEPLFFGHLVYHLINDPRDRRTMLAAAKTGHLGPTVFRSSDCGRTWKEATQPLAFPKSAEKPRVVDHTFWLTPGHASEPNVWYAGTSPQGLFRSEDGGDTWQPVAGFNEGPNYADWTALEAPPDGARLHSVNIDPRDPKHMYIGMSLGGVFETHDQGATWSPLNKGCELDWLPGQELEYGHDPHCVRVHPQHPDRLYQQNHCGVYRMDRTEGRWHRIGRNLPKEVGDIGFPMVVHPSDPERCWVFPMDGTEVWPRTSPGGKPAVFMTKDAGTTWVRQDRGLPAKNAWFTVYRQAMQMNSEGALAFGTTQGEVWLSRDEGEWWSREVDHLPRVQSIEWAQFE
jgi:photosystem II stability/assembly factor-like uncharacterized protein